MFGAKKRSYSKRRSQSQRVAIELLETRQLLSAADNSIIMYPDSIFVHTAAVSNTVQGLTPQQIRTAYGFDQISLGSGSVTGNGQGQTIAIVDAYNDPNITSDLNVFDSEFGIAAPPSFKTVNETGGTSLPTSDSGWAGEISLDVEWAHAIAPSANILLVEASSATLSDLLSAVDYARSAPGVSVVSMSWGGGEFFSNSGGEDSSELADDFHFTTPAGHQGVTFVSAAGDSGSGQGVEWPAASPNVVSVGGTTLLLADNNGDYGGEQSWQGTTGGFSVYEPTPAYQQAVNPNSTRTIPDVAYDANPSTGVAVYDSFPDQGFSGWQQVGGTSAGAPQWSALLAIANQGRALSGQASLDGESQTLSMLYGLYSAPGTAGYNTTYTTAFNDVIDSGGGRFSRSNNRATAGFDTITGLGTPKAAQLIDDLVGTTSSAAGATISGAVYDDLGDNGVLSGSDPALAGQHVWLDLNNDGDWEPGEPAAVTDANGSYSFTGLAAGTYTVRYYAPPGTHQTAPANVGAQLVTMGTNGAVTGINFLVASGAPDITGVVFDDLNSSGVQTAADPTLAGQHVWIDTNNDGRWEPGEPAAVTDANGDYSFSNLADGAYVVRYYTPPGFDQTFPGSSGAQVITIAGASATGVDFGVA